MDATLRGHSETIGQRMEQDLDVLLPLLAVPYDACERRANRVSSLSLVRYCTNDDSVQGRGYVGQVVISCGAELRIVQDLMGHVSVATTQVYTHITKPEARKAYRQFHQLAKGFRSAQRRIDEVASREN